MHSNGLYWRANKKLQKTITMRWSLTFSNSFSWMSSMVWILLITSRKDSPCGVGGGNTQCECGKQVSNTLGSNKWAPSPVWSWARRESQRSQRPLCGSERPGLTFHCPCPSPPGPKESPERGKERGEREEGQDRFHSACFCWPPVADALTVLQWCRVALRVWSVRLHITVRCGSRCNRLERFSQRRSSLQLSKSFICEAYYFEGAKRWLQSGCLCK